MGAPSLALLGALALAALLAMRLASDGGGGGDSQNQQRCETTYLWEGYEVVPMPPDLQPAFPRYSLHKFADRDPYRLAEQRTLQEGGAVVPVLFVHGHMGSYQQMRSAASESGRELVRRLRHGGSSGEGKDWSLWLQWYGADFDSEPSALEPTLLARQARFVAHCALLLQRTHTNSSASSPQRLVLVGYSMGALVARAALHLLAAEPQFDVSSVALLITLASPPTVPALVPPRAFHQLLATPLSAAAAAQLSAVPRASVVAGCADLMLPYTAAARTPLPGERSAAVELSVGMQDIPAVWTSTNHKGIVSCNQLVRQLVPLLVDSVQLALTEGHSQQAASGVAELMQRQLTAGFGGVLWPLDQGSTLRPTLPLQACVSPSGEVEEQPPGALMLQRGEGSAPVTLVWNVSQQLAAKQAGLLVLTAAVQPCRDFAILLPTSSSKRGGATMPPAQATLPPLLPSLRRTSRGPRPAADILAGIDWLQNATRLAYIPFSQRQGSIQIAVRGGDPASSSAILARTLPANPAEALLQLPAAGSAVVGQGHPALLRLQLPQHRWPASVPWAPHLATLLLGRSLPLALQIAVGQCATAGEGEPGEHLLPTLVAAASKGRAADQVQVGSSHGSSTFQLWRGGMQLPHSALLLVSDPRCEYHLRLRLDLVGWLSLSLRHHLFAIIPLAVAWCQLRGAQSPASSAAVPQKSSWALATAVLAAWVSQHPPQMLGGIGLQPWIELSVLEAAALLALAAGVAAVSRAALQLAIWVWGVASPSRRLRLPARVQALSLFLASVVHPSLPLLVGNVAGLLEAAAYSDSAASKQGAVAASEQELSSINLLAASCLLAWLPATQLVAWLLNGMHYSYEWTVERFMLILLGLHACRGSVPGGRRRMHLVRPLHWLLAACTALAALWGSPFVALYTSLLISKICTIIHWKTPNNR